VIDAETAARLTACGRSAVHEGRDVWEECDRWGLLLTKMRRELIVHATLRDAVVQLESLGAAGVMQARWGRSEGTPGDMFDAVTAWMELWIKGRSDR
jgi:hypothetical protein